MEDAESEDEEKAGTVDKGTGKGRGRGRRRSSSRSKSKAAAATAAATAALFPEGRLPSTRGLSPEMGTERELRYHGEVNARIGRDTKFS